MVRINLFEDSLLEINGEMYDIVKYTKEVSLHNWGQIYLLYRKNTGAHCWTKLHFDRFHSIKFIQFDKNNNFIEYKPNRNCQFFNTEETDVYILCKNNVHFDLKLKHIPPTFKLRQKYYKYWKEYCAELNENKNANAIYPIKKISHMREIVDLIESFL